MNKYNFKHRNIKSFIENNYRWIIEGLKNATIYAITNDCYDGKTFFLEWKKGELE